MDKQKKQSSVDRRQALKMIGIGSGVGLLGLFGTNLKADAACYEKPFYARGMAQITIKSVRAIGTAPAGANLVIVKVETSEPGLYGVGCATFTQRAEVVVTAINNYLG